ncbi:TIGR02234 family membrane protein [Nocardia sp. NPDC050793]|uniref:TIGR02234 family membrane protein n=1 Tax=Nocardia sp. NPDC050793 TaxID=3155159 RepID=UPI0033FF8DA4
MTGAEPERDPRASAETGEPPAAEAAAPARRAERRRYPIGAIVLLALAAALMWGSSRLTWVTVSSSDGLTEPRTDELNGGVWFGALTPLALVLLAAIAALLATRGWLRRMVGVLVALVAAVTAVPAFALLTGQGATNERAAALAELPGRATVTEVTTAPSPAVLTMAAALAAFAAGVLLARMPSESGRLSGKYESPVVRREAAAEEVTKQRAADTSGQLSERVLWDALDAGTDPTDDTPGTGANSRNGSEQAPRDRAEPDSRDSAEPNSRDRAVDGGAG